MAPISYLTRTESFSAAHRLHSPLLSDAENHSLYGKCNHPNYHGHNYKVEITLRGKIDPVTGMVLNMVDLKECIRTSILDKLDHKNLDADVTYFQDRPSTTENLAVYIWDSFEAVFKHHPACDRVRLYRVKIHETERNSVEYMGEESAETNGNHAV